MTDKKEELSSELKQGLLLLSLLAIMAVIRWEVALFTFIYLVALLFIHT